MLWKIMEVCKYLLVLFSNFLYVRYISVMNFLDGLRQKYPDPAKNNFPEQKTGDTSTSENHFVVSFVRSVWCLLVNSPLHMLSAIVVAQAFELQEQRSW